MRFCLARLPLIAALGASLAGGPWPVRAADTNKVSAVTPEQRERDECKKNLETIHAAITAYRRDRQDLPMWLSDLVPKYLSDANVLLCPVCRRTGAVEPPPLSDPKIPSSYLFEFCPLPLGDFNPKDPTRTRREWKRRQMGVLGSIVPVVRCRHHNPTLNLSFDGKIFEAPPHWELAFQDLAKPSSLLASNLFAGDPPRRAAGKYPSRSPKATPRQIDLSRFYNAGLGENWLGRTNENFSAAPKGLQIVEGTAFDLRGLVQLAGKGLNKKFPGKVASVPVGLKCKRLRFLHALAGWTEGDAGKPAGAYVIKYAGNNARVQIPLICGKDLGYWKASVPGEDKGLKTGWESTTKNANGVKARLFITTWDNLAPNLEIESIELVSDTATGGLLVAGISAE